MAQSTNQLPALLIVGHGTRNRDGQNEFLRATAAVAQRYPAAVEPCFLEMAEPTIETSVKRLHERGARAVVAMPLLLFAAGHAKQDIPNAVQAAVDKFGLDLVAQTQPLQCHDEVVRLSADRFRAAIAGAPTASSGGTWLVMVGRGSRDAEATSEMKRFAALRAEATPVDAQYTCFVAMASPSLKDTFAAIGVSIRESVGEAPTRVVVQPHLLFQGDLSEKIRLEVERAKAQMPNTQWVVTEHLGVDERLVNAVIDIVTETLRAKTEPILDGARINRTNSTE